MRGSILFCCFRLRYYFFPLKPHYFVGTYWILYQLLWNEYKNIKHNSIAIRSVYIWKRKIQNVETSHNMYSVISNLKISLENYIHKKKQNNKSFFFFKFFLIGTRVKSKVKKKKIFFILRKFKNNFFFKCLKREVYNFI